MTLPKHVTLKQFMAPTGSGGATGDKALKEQLEAFYDAEDFDGKIKMDIYRKDKSYVFVMKIPSQHIDKYTKEIFYDVILEFYPIGDIKMAIASPSIRDYGIRAYSNYPPFIFTFTYVYNKIGAIPKFIDKKKLGDKAVKIKPDRSNPYMLIGIDKSLWYGLHRISKKTHYNKSYIDKLIDKDATLPDFKDLVSQEAKIDELNKSIKPKPKKKKETSASKSKPTLNNAVPSGLIKTFKDDSLKTSFTSNLKSSSLKSNLKSKLTRNPFSKSFKK